jgi:hypothetical protein
VGVVERHATGADRDRHLGDRPDPGSDGSGYDDVAARTRAVEDAAVIDVALSVNGQAPVVPGRTVADRTEGNGVEPDPALASAGRLL